MSTDDSKAIAPLAAENIHGEGDPFTFDVICLRCGTVFPNVKPWCPMCEEEHEGVAYEW